MKPTPGQKLLTKSSLDALLRYIWKKPKRIPAEQYVELRWTWANGFLEFGDNRELTLEMSTWRGYGRDEVSKSWRWWRTEVNIDLPLFIYGEREAVSWLVETVGQAVRYLEAMVIPPPRPKEWRLFPCSSVPRRAAKRTWSSRIGKKTSITRVLQRVGATG